MAAAPRELAARRGCAAACRGARRRLRVRRWAALRGSVSGRSSCSSSARASIGLLLATVAWLVERRGLPRIDLRPARRLGARVARDAAPAVSAVQRRARDVHAGRRRASRPAPRRKARAVDWSGWPYAGGTPHPGPPRPKAPSTVVRFELNARGAQLRSEGHPKEAAEQHSQALAIFRKLGDRSGEAPTLNSLALALDAAGETGRRGRAVRGGAHDPARPRRRAPRGQA